MVDEFCFIFVDIFIIFYSGTNKPMSIIQHKMLSTWIKLTCFKIIIINRTFFWSSYFYTKMLIHTHVVFVGKTTDIHVQCNSKLSKIHFGIRLTTYYRPIPVYDNAILLNVYRRTPKLNRK